MAPPFLDPATCWDELHFLAARAGVSVEYLCATAQSATQFARDSISAHKAQANQNQSLPYPTYDDELDAVICGLWDDGFGNDDFEFEVKQIPWNESEHPRDDRGRFSNGGASGSLGGHGDADIASHEVVQPFIPADEYQPPTKVLSANEARDEMERLHQEINSEQRPLKRKLEQIGDHLKYLNTQSASNPAQQAALDEQRKKARDYIKILSRKLETAERTGTARLRAVLYVTDPVDVNVRFDTRPGYENITVPITAQKQKDAAITGAEEVRRFVSRELQIGDMYFERENRREARSKYRAPRRVLLTDDAGTRVVVHEFGHGIESLNDKVSQKVLDFREARTQGEPPLDLNKEDSRYGTEEKFMRDKFIHPYMGKLYPGTKSTEILSMGLEYFYNDPLELARKDPDYFDFVYNTLRGN